MIRNLIIILGFLAICHGTSEAGPNIAVIQSIRAKPYEEAIEGFKTATNSKIRRLVLAELKGADVVKEIEEIKPDIILAVGMEALVRVKSISTIPTVYCMVLDPQSIISQEKHITGVSMNVPQEMQLLVLLTALPHVKRVSLLYDPRLTGCFVDRAKNAAEKLGVRLVAREIFRSRDFPLLIKTFQGNADVFWMLPDVTVVTPETIEFLLLFSLENKIPILTFSERYVELGALMSVGIDAFDIGAQAGEMAQKILSGYDIRTVPRVDARKAVLSINLKIAKKLGIQIDEEIIRKARIVN